jgi:hypothetical protein
VFFQFEAMFDMHTQAISDSEGMPHIPYHRPFITCRYINPNHWHLTGDTGIVPKLDPDGLSDVSTIDWDRDLEGARLPRARADPT